MASFTIRPAVADDMENVFRLIQELADFEKMPNGPKINPDILRQDGFSAKNPLFNCFVAEIANEVIGFALYYLSYSTWLGKAMFLEDLYVKQELRMKGIGQSLFKAVAKEAINLDCKRLDFRVLSWNPATKFYEKLGAANITTTEDWSCFRMGWNEMKHLCQN